MGDAGPNRFTWARTAFRWATYVGFWWSLLSLAYSMRTPQLALQMLESWLSILGWSLSPLYFVWSLLRDAFVALTRPLYELLPFDLPQELRDGVSFGFFTGVRFFPAIFKRTYGWFVNSSSGVAILASILSMFALFGFGLPYLLASDHAQRWLPFSAINNFWVTYLLAGAFGCLLWLVTDPFDFVSVVSTDKDETPEDKQS